MSGFDTELVPWLVAVPWLEIIKAMAPVFTAWIAFRALKNWKWQDRAKREAEFLDQLIDSTHQYILDMQRPVELVRNARTSMACHSDSFGRGEEIEQIRSGAIAYISSRGEEDGKRLQEALTAVDPSIIQLKFLAAKGQIFKFPEYSKCYNALTLLIWHYGRIQAFLSIIQAPSWNWDNIHVTSLLEKIITINPDQVLEDFARQDTQIIEFCRGSYQKIYG